jgi:hypothetical protein
MIRSNKKPNEIPTADVQIITAGNLLAYDNWLESIPVSKITGWRWRKRGLIKATNIYGRLYVTRAAIAEFEQRAGAGEFEQIHRTPRALGQRAIQRP